MDKILNLFPKALLSAYVIKMITFSPTFIDASIIAALSAVVGVQIFLEKKNSIDEVRTHCNKQIEEIKAVVNKQIEVISTMSVEVAKCKQDMQGIKLKNSFLEAGNPLTGKKAG